MNFYAICMQPLLTIAVQQHTLNLTMKFELMSRTRINRLMKSLCKINSIPFVCIFGLSIVSFAVGVGWIQSLSLHARSHTICMRWKCARVFATRFSESKLTNRQNSRGSVRDFSETVRSTARNVHIV